MLSLMSVGVYENCIYAGTYKAGMCPRRWLFHR